MEDDHRPLLRREAPEATGELITDGHGALGVGCHRLVRRLEGELDDLPPPALFRGPVAGPHKQAMQPGVEPVRVTQTAEVAPGLEESILDGISGLLVVAEDEPGGPEKPIGRARGQGREGVEIALLRPNHEVSLHRSALGVAVVWPLCPVWGRVWLDCSVFASRVTRTHGQRSRPSWEGPSLSRTLHSPEDQVPTENHMGHRWQAHPQRRRSRRLRVATPGAAVLFALVATLGASTLSAQFGADGQRPAESVAPPVAANLGLPASDLAAAPARTAVAATSVGDSGERALAAIQALTARPEPSSPKAPSDGAGPIARERVGRGSKVVFLGDSYTSGWNGAGIGARGWPRMVASARRWTAINLAVPGSGFMDPGSSGQPVGSMVGRAIARHPDVVMLAAGHNDFTWALSDTVAAADRVIMRIHRSLPHALLVVVGPIWPNDRPPTATLALRNHLRRVAGKVDALFIDPIAERWFAGSRQTLIGSDGLHPSDQGHDFMAKRVLRDIARKGI